MATKQTNVPGLVIRDQELEYEGGIKEVWWVYFHERSNTRLKFFNSKNPDDMIAFSGALSVFDFEQSIELLNLQIKNNTEKLIFIRDTFDTMFPEAAMVKFT